MSWDIREQEAETTSSADLGTQQPTIFTFDDGKMLVGLPKQLRDEFGKDCPLKLVGQTLSPGWGGSWRNDWRGRWIEGDDKPAAKAKARKELQEALDWLLEQEANQGSGESAAATPMEKETGIMTKEQEKEIKAPGIIWENRTSIGLPGRPALREDMPARTAAKALLDKAKEEEQQIAIMEEVADAFPWDAAVQFSRAMGQLHGWGRAVAKQTFFGERPPLSIGVQTGPDTHEEVIWGPFRIPGMDEGELECGTSEKDGRVIFCIRGTVKKKDLPLVRALADLTRQLTKSHSIYKGKAIQLIVADEGNINWMEQPRFLNPPVHMEDLIYDQDTLDQIGTHLVAPIVKRKMLAQIGRPFGGAVLMSGTYGVGKTVLAAALANICTGAEVTFIDVPSLKAVKETLIAARPLGPALVFVEDIDRISKEAERNEATQEIMNTVASVSSKGTEVMAVFTTNRPGAISPGLVQRFNGVIVIDPPKAPEVSKLIRLYGKSLIDLDENLDEAAEYLSGKVPRTIEQIVQSAKQYAVHRNNVNSVDEIRIIGRDIIGAARQKEFQLQLESRNEEKIYTPEERVGMDMAALVGQSLGKVLTPKAIKGLEVFADKFGGK